MVDSPSHSPGHVESSTVCTTLANQLDDAAACAYSALSERTYETARQDTDQLCAIGRSLLEKDVQNLVL